MLEAKFDDFKEDINTTKTYIAKKYGYLIKNISPQMAAIQKYFPKYRVFEKFHEEVALNFFKYKEYYEATKVLTQEVSDPFVKLSIEKANITQEQVDSCKQGSCEAEMLDSEIHLVSPMELLRMSSNVLTDIGAGHLLKFLLDGHSDKGIIVTGTNEFRREASEIINRVLGSNFGYNMLELSKYLSHGFNRKDWSIADDDKFYSIGEITKESKCDKDASKLYSIFWAAYMLNEDKRLHYNCSNQHKACSDIGPDCFQYNPVHSKDCSSIVLENPPCKDEQLSKSFNFMPCCDLVKSFTENFQATLKLMKYSVQSVHFQESSEEEGRVFANITNAFEDSKYFIKPSGPLNRRNFNNFIPLCQYAGQPEEMKFENCNLFKRSISNLGLSFSFNTDNFWNIYQSNKYNSIFENIMFPNMDSEIQFPDSSGPDYRLRFILNGKLILFLRAMNCFCDPGDENNAAEYWKTNGDDYTKAVSEFTVGVHDPSVPANLRGEGIKVKTGYETTIMVTPRVLHTTDMAISMPFEDRQCRASSEADAAGLKIFKKYSREACVLECSLRMSRKKCGCTPWNYPLVLEEEENDGLCDVFGNYCFHQAMKESTTKPECDCPNDCRTYGYSITVSASFINEQLNCPSNAKGIFGEFQGPLGLPKMFLAYYNSIVNKVIRECTTQMSPDHQYSPG